MSQFKQMIKACLRPLFRGLKRPGRPILRRLRDYFTRSVHEHLAASTRHLFEGLEQVRGQGEHLRGAVEVVRGQVDGHAHSLYDLARSTQEFARFTQEFARSAQEFARSTQEITLETDRLLLALLKGTQSARPAPGAERTETRVIPLGGQRLLAAHPVAPFVYLESIRDAWTPRLLLADWGGLFALLRGLIAEGDTVVEVGAHQGYFTLGLALLVGPTGRVLAVEADPWLRELIAANLADHQVQERVEVVPDFPGLQQALGSAPRQPRLFLLTLPGVSEELLRPVLGSLAENTDNTHLFSPEDETPGEGTYRFWRVGADGLLHPVAPDALPQVGGAPAGHYVAARDLGEAA